VAPGSGRDQKESKALVTLLGFKNKSPADFSAGLRFNSICAYFAQQPRWAWQHAPPLQQSAELEVALAVPINAVAATINMNKYFIEIPSVELHCVFSPAKQASRCR
jgi:hypothetical protein